MKPARAARMLFNRHRGEARVDGIRLPIDRTVLSPKMEYTLAKGRYEYGEARQAARVISPGDTVLELGSGIGFVSSYLRRHTAAGKIICVEANPELIPFIRRVHAINEIEDTVVLNGVAQVPPCSAAVPFYSRRDFWASSLDADSEPYEKIVKVPGLNFIELLETYRPNVLVMDIEGGELSLLATPELKHVRSIVMEVHVSSYGQTGLDQLLADARRLGFSVDPRGTAREVHTLVRPDPTS